MPLFDKLVAAALGAFTGELKETRKVLQAGIDTYREVNGMPRLYSEVPEEDLPETMELDPKAPKPLAGMGDFLTQDILQELAREYAVRYASGAELEAEARSRGWVDDDGKFLMLPRSYQGLPVGDLSIFPSGEGRQSA